MLKSFTVLSVLVLVALLLSPLLMCHSTDWAGGYDGWAGGYDGWAGGYSGWAGGYTSWSGGYSSWAGGLSWAD
jgi:hypothetical protein